MPRYYDTPDRDERGRFVSDDDHRRSSNYGSGYNNRTGRDRDEYGRFMSDDDRGNHSVRRYGYDNEHRYSRGRDEYSNDQGQGGWFGDSAGHSEASRLGWSHRDDYRGGRPFSRYDNDDRRYSSRGDEYSNDHGQSGWFGDREGHSEASRLGWSRRGGSRASGRYDNDDRRYSSRGDAYSNDHGQGGWFGDREGHSEASRRGWETRRSEYDDRSRGYGRN